MPSVTDWLMVGITFVYVIATIFICIFNGRSAKATREQVAESQRQFDETKRLERMPYFDVDILEEQDSDRLFHPDVFLCVSDQHPKHCTLISECLIFKNIGAGTATHLTYSWLNTRKERQEGQFPFSTFEEKQTREQHFCFQTALFPDGEDIDEYTKYSEYEATPSLLLIFDDLLGNKYEQELRFEFSISSADKTKLRNVKVYEPKLIKSISETKDV